MKIFFEYLTLIFRGCLCGKKYIQQSDFLLLLPVFYHIT